MKINIILNNLPQKSETFLISWIQQLSLNGYKVRIITVNCWYFTKSDRRKMIRNVEYCSKWNILLLTLAFIKGFYKIKFRSKYRELLISQGNPDLVHFSYSAIGINFIREIKNLKKKMNIAFIVSCRGTSDNIKPYTEDGRKELICSLFKVIHQVHCVSQEMLDRMVRDFGLDRAKGFVNRPAIDINKFQSISHEHFVNNNKIVILSTGRLEYVKGFIFALMAIKDLIDEGFELEYRILGYGSDEEALKFYCNRLEIESHVKLLGGLDHSQVLGEIRKCNIFLSSSLSEGISNAVLEAMAMKVPVVSTNVGGMSEVVINEKTGILVKPYDSIAISGALKKLIFDKTLSHNISKAGELLIREEYNLNRLFNVFDSQYKIVK
jgi:colanic acid/amylovoran biosynthesis glycosyltransferase